MTMSELATDTAKVLTLATAEKLGIPDSDQETMRRIVEIADQFADQVYGAKTHSRMESLNAIPTDEIGTAFRDVERLVQPNGFP